MPAILDLAVNELMKDVIVILEATKYEADKIIIEDAGVATTHTQNIFQTFKGSWLKFELIQDTMVILVTSKYEEDPIKIEGARVATIQNIDFSNTNGQLTPQSEFGSGRTSNSSEMLWMSSLLPRIKKNPVRSFTGMDRNGLIAGMDYRNGHLYVSLCTFHLVFDDRLA